MAEQDGFDLGSIWDYTKSAGSAVGDAISTHSGLLSSIGGALGAHATGGQQGLNTFMAAVVQRDQQALARDFQREMFDREKSFTMRRDKLSRAHDKELAQLKNQTTDVVELNARANLLVGRMANDPAIRTQVLAGLDVLGKVPAGLSDQWHTTDEALQVARIFEASVPKGRSAQLPAEVAGLREAYAQFGAEAPADATPLDAAEFVRQGRAVEGTLLSQSTALTSWGEELAEELKETDPSKRLQRLNSISRPALDRVGTALNGVRSGPGQSYLGDGMPLGNSYVVTQALWRENQRTLDRETSKAQVDMASAEDLSLGNFGSWEAFNPEIIGTEDQFSRVLDNPQIQEQEAKFNRTLNYLSGLTDEQFTALGYSSDRQLTALRKAAHDAKAKQEEYGFEQKARSARDLALEGKAGELDKLGQMVQRGMRFDYGSEAKRLVADENTALATEEVQMLLDQLASPKTGTGLDLSALGSAEDLVATYGVMGTIGAGTSYGIPPFEHKIWGPRAQQKLLNSDAFGDVVADALQVSFGQDVGGTMISIDPSQSKVIALNRLASFADKLGLTEKQRDYIAEQLGGVAPAAFTRTETVSELHSFDKGTVPWLTENIVDQRSTLTPEDLEERERGIVLKAKLHGGVTNERELHKTITDLLGIARREHPEMQTPKGGWSAFGRQQALTGEWQQAQFEAEAEGSSAITLRDVVEMTASLAPRLGMTTKGAGRPSSRLVAMPLLSDDVWLPGPLLPDAEYDKGYWLENSLENAYDSQQGLKRGSTPSPFPAEQGELNLGPMAAMRGEPTYPEHWADEDVARHNDRAGKLSMLDAIRAYNFGAQPGITEDELRIALGMQGFLRSLSPDQAVSFIEDPASFGLTPEMFSLDTDFLLQNQTDPRTFSLFPISSSRLSSEIGRIDTALSEIATMTARGRGIGQPFDVDPGAGMTVKVIEEADITAEITKLEELKTRAVAMQEAHRGYEITEAGVDGLSQLVTFGGSFPTSAEELSTRIAENGRLLFERADVDLTAMVQTTWDGLAADLLNEEGAGPVGMREAVRTIIDQLAIDDIKIRDARKVGSVIPKADQLELAKAAQSGYQEMFSQIEDLERAIVRGELFTAAQCRPDLQQALLRGGYDDIEDTFAKAMALYSVISRRKVGTGG